MILLCRFTLAKPFHLHLKLIFPLLSLSSGYIPIKTISMLRWTKLLFNVSVCWCQLCLWFVVFTGSQDKSIDLAKPPSRLRLLRRNQIATAPPPLPFKTCLLQQFLRWWSIARPHFNANSLLSILCPSNSVKIRLEAAVAIRVPSPLASHGPWSQC